MCTLLQHIHICVWPHLLSPFVKLATHSEPHSPHPARQKKKESGAKEVGAESTFPRIEVDVEVNNVSLALVEKPSDVTSYGLCAEVGGKEGGRGRRE